MGPDALALPSEAAVLTKKMLSCPESQSHRIAYYPLRSLLIDTDSVFILNQSQLKRKWRESKFAVRKLCHFGTIQLKFAY
jgi:hypothetical protein